MADKLRYIPNDDTQNYPFYGLNARTLYLIDKLIKIQKVPKVLKPTNCNYKTFETSVINNPMSPPSLNYTAPTAKGPPQVASITKIKM